LDNTVQIRDRTVSAHHLELIDEGDHYRLHDLGATNGVLVDGQPVTDFHLCQACKIAIGGVQLEFSPDTPAPSSSEPSLELATRAECEALIRDKADLTQEVKTLREEVDLLQQKHAAEPGTPSVPQAEFDRVVAELARIKELVAERDRQIERLMSSRAVLQRDRDNLQRAIDEAASAPVRVVVATAVPAPAAATPVAAPAVPKLVAPVPVAMAATPKLATPAQKPTTVPPPTAPSIAGAPKPKPVFVPVPAAPAAGAAPGASQLPKPPGTLKPAAVAAGAPTPATKGPTSPLKPFAATPATIGPKGTQRIKV